MNTLRSLEEALENFAGCAVIISHDRWFLDRVATAMLVFGTGGKVRLVAGNYSDYLAAGGEEEEAETAAAILYAPRAERPGQPSPRYSRRRTGTAYPRLA